MEGLTIYEAVTMKMMSKTSMTSTSGVTLIPTISSSSSCVFEATQCCPGLLMEASTMRDKKSVFPMRTFCEPLK